MTTDNNPQQEGQEKEREVSECPMCGNAVFVERRQKRGRRTSRTRDTVLFYVPITDGDLQSRLTAAEAQIERMRPVVEAAKEWQHSWGGPGDGFDPERTAKAEEAVANAFLRYEGEQWQAEAEAEAPQP